MTGIDKPHAEALAQANKTNLVQALILGGLVALLLLLAGLGLYRWFGGHDQVAIWDFHPRWLGLRLLLTEGANPYGQEVTDIIQRQMYGRLALPTEDQIAFAYPLSVMALIAPLALLPLPLAQTLWMLLLLVSLLIFLFSVPRVTGWQPPVWLLALTVIFGIGLYPNAWALLLGQASIVVALLLVLTWWSLQKEQWTLAGIFLALTTVKPQMVFLVVPWLLLWTILGRRWRMIGSFAVSFAALTAMPMIWLPDWPLEWLAAASRYAGYTPFEPPLKLLTGFHTLSIAAAVLLLGWVLWWWRGKETRFGWAFSFVIVINALIAPRTSQANQLVLLLPLFFLFGRIRRPWAILLIEGVLLAGLWWLDAQWLPPVTSPEHVLWQHRLISPILPLCLTLALLAFSPRLPQGRAEDAE
jgi:hypothetical protein